MNMSMIIALFFIHWLEWYALTSVLALNSAALIGWGDTNFYRHTSQYSRRKELMPDVSRTGTAESELRGGCRDALCVAMRPTGESSAVMQTRQ